MGEPRPYYMPRPDFLPPGSDKAIAEGCLCPVLDNNHGRFPVYPPDDDYPDGSWWIRNDCPVHQEFEDAVETGGPNLDSPRPNPSSTAHFGAQGGESGPDDGGWA